MQWEILNIQKLKVKLYVQIVHVAATMHGIIDIGGTEYKLAKRSRTMHGHLTYSSFLFFYMPSTGRVSLLAGIALKCLVQVISLIHLAYLPH